MAMVRRQLSVVRCGRAMRRFRDTVAFSIHRQPDVMAVSDKRISAAAHRDAQMWRVLLVVMPGVNNN
jgi:hypothetical protein